MREVCAKHDLERLAELCQWGYLATLVKQHQGELRRGMVAFVKKQLQVAKLDPLRGTQLGLRGLALLCGIVQARQGVPLSGSPSQHEHGRQQLALTAFWRVDSPLQS